MDNPILDNRLFLKAGYIVIHIQHKNPSSKFKLMNSTLIYPTQCKNKSTDLLWLSPLNYSNSFAYVSKLLLPRLRKYNPTLKIKVLALGKTFSNEIKDKIARDIGFDSDSIFILPSRTRDSLGFSDLDKQWFQDFLVGSYTLSMLIQYLNPKMVISLYDSGPLTKQIESISKWNGKFVPYLPIDTEFSYIDDCLLKCEHLLTMSEHSKILLDEQGAKSVVILPHIVESHDTKCDLASDVSKCNHETINYNKRWFPEGVDIIIGTVNANHVRKKLDLVIEAFIAAGDILNWEKKIGLLIKTTPESKEKFSTHDSRGFNLKDLENSIYQRRPHVDKLLIKIVTDVLSTEDLHSVYKAIDIFVHPTSGEGFGLTPLESVLIGNCLPLVSNNTSMPYLFGKDYFGLVDCDAKSYYHENTSNNSYKCILKSYLSSQPNLETVDSISISMFNAMIVISDNGYPIDMVMSDLKKGISRNPRITFNDHKPTRIIHTNDLKDILDNLETLNSYFPFYQLLINTNSTFMSEQLGISDNNFPMKFKDLSWLKEYWEKSVISKNRNVIQLSFDELTKQLTDKNGVRSVPRIDSISNKMSNLLAMSKTDKDIILKKIKSRISKICNPDTIIKQLDAFIRMAIE